MLIAVAVVASACGGDTSDEGSVDEAAAQTEYFESLQAIAIEGSEVTDEAFGALIANAEQQAPETLLPEFSVALGVVVAQLEDAIAQYEALDPPQAFAADHQRTIRYLQDRIEATTRQRAAADARDTETMAQIELELASLERRALADVSPEFSRSALPETTSGAVGDLFGDLDSDEADYLDAVSAGWDEFARRNREFARALEQSYASDELLLRALLDAGAGEAFAAVQSVMVDIDPPESYAAAHELLLAHLEELVALDSVIADAARDGDVVRFEVANYGLAIAGARYALEAPPALAAINSNPEDLGSPSGLSGGTFGDELWHELQRFRILAWRTQIESGVFPVVSDEKLAAAMAEVMPSVIDLTEDAIVDVGALDPPADLEAGHDRVLSYLQDLRELRQSVLAAAAAGDLETLRQYGELGGFAADRAETELWCAARADLTDDPIEPITDILFRSSDAGNEDGLCPGAGD